MKCPNCQTENRKGAIYCRTCAQPLKVNRVCPQCGQVNPGDSKFCDKCGSKQEFAQENMPSSVDDVVTHPQNIAPKQYPNKAIVISDSGIYQEADLNSRLIYRIYKGNPLLILGEKGDFYHVERKHGFDFISEGYVIKAVVFVGNKNTIKNHPETRPNLEIESSAKPPIDHSVGDSTGDKAIAKFKARAEAGAREKRAAPQERICEWCHESISSEAVRCPRCHKFRKDIENDRLKFYFWLLFAFVPIVFFGVGLNRGWWNKISGSIFSLNYEFSLGEFLSSASGFFILAGFVL